MRKLIIKDITKINSYWYAVRFSGMDDAYTAMNVYLAQQQKDHVYWDVNAFHGKGAWMVRLDFFKRLTARFENLERALVLAEREEALQKINTLAKRRQ